MVTENRKAEIKVQTHILLETFGEVLDKLPVKKVTSKNQGSGTRIEGSKPVANSEFRERMFTNAPKKNADFIIAEKGAWA